MVGKGSPDESVCGAGTQCLNHGKTKNLMACSRCHTVKYCSRDCQRIAWKTHKKSCGAFTADLHLLRAENLCNHNSVNTSVLNLFEKVYLNCDFTKEEVRAPFKSCQGPSAAIKFITQRLDSFPDPDMDRPCPGDAGRRFGSIRSVMMQVVWDLANYPECLLAMCKVDEGQCVVDLLQLWKKTKIGACQLLSGRDKARIHEPYMSKYMKAEGVVGNLHEINPNRAIAMDVLRILGTMGTCLQTLSMVATQMSDVKDIHIVHLFVSLIQSPGGPIPSIERRPNPDEVNMFRALAHLEKKYGSQLLFVCLREITGTEQSDVRLMLSKHTSRRCIKMGKTPCCGKWVCDTEDEYAPNSYEREGQCMRNHRLMTACGIHHSRKHKGDWKTCTECPKLFMPAQYAAYRSTRREAFYPFNFVEDADDFNPEWNALDIPPPVCCVEGCELRCGYVFAEYETVTTNRRAYSNGHVFCTEHGGGQGMSVLWEKLGLKLKKECRGGKEYENCPRIMKVERRI
eukprot:Nk52_evm21s2367 gene=Nk52_evmTU21s2367